LNFALVVAANGKEHIKDNGKVAESLQINVQAAIIPAISLLPSVLLDNCVGFLVPTGPPRTALVSGSASKALSSLVVDPPPRDQYQSL